MRPPGHHAEPDVIMGFCFFNYVAAAAALLKDECGLDRILVVDWDVHHGNGTQRMFYSDPSVLLVSLHRYEDGAFYPGTGSMHECGAGPGLGYNVNIPWPHGGVGDGAYLAAFERIVMPIARAFKPQAVLVSAGFDAAAGDPLGGCCVSPHGYACMTNMLRGLAGGRLVVALEGGYNLRSIATSMEAVLRVLLGEAPTEEDGSSDDDDAGDGHEASGSGLVSEAAHSAGMQASIMETLRDVIAVQVEHWPSLALACPNEAGAGKPVAAGGGEGQQEEVDAGRARAQGTRRARKKKGAKRGMGGLQRFFGRSFMWRWHVMARKAAAKARVHTKES